MSSKISHPPAGVLHSAPQVPAKSGAKSAAAAKGGAKSAVRKRPQMDAAHGEDELFQDDMKEDAHKDHKQGTQELRGRSPQPQAGLAPPQAHAGVSQVRQKPIASDGRRAEHSKWARLISQASPERLAEGQAALGQHQTALDAFAKLVPGLSKLSS